MRHHSYLLLGTVFLCLGTHSLRAQEPKTTHKEDVIYGRKHGLAMTMDVFIPEKQNGAGVVYAVSGGWFSAKRNINQFLFLSFLKRGYTVFAVVHGSQPKFTIPEIIDDMHRAVRYIRHHAKDYKIDPDKLGITGASAGGHLSLIIGMSGRKGDPKARDPVDRESSRVRAVACFFPPTDFLNYGKEGVEMIDRDFQPPFTAATDYHRFDREKALFIPITDKEELRKISKDISPISHISPDDPPTLIIHGDKDGLVPLQQSKTFIEKLKKEEVPAKLVVKKGAGHGWATLLLDIETFAKWFDEHLLEK